MFRLITILLVASSLSACSTQAFSWLVSEIQEERESNRSRPFDIEYDEAAIFPSPNQRLACELDTGCEKPLSETEFDRLSDEEKLHVLYGDDTEKP